VVVGVVSGLGVDTILCTLAAIVGAGAAAYALGQFRRETWLYLGLCLATAGLLGVLIFIGGLSGTHTVQPIAGRLEPDALQGIESLHLLIPVMFMMEEVAFRGAIDSHVRHPGERHGLGSSVYGIVSAIVVSVLWGLWHLPIIPLPPTRPSLCGSSGWSTSKWRWDPSSRSSGAGRGTSWCPGSRMPRWTRYETPSGGVSRRAGRLPRGGGPI
jgi:membrane protease YdiL (CAAX protease family)